MVSVVPFHPAGALEFASPKSSFVSSSVLAHTLPPAALCIAPFLSSHQLAAMASAPAQSSSGGGINLTTVEIKANMTSGGNSAFRNYKLVHPQCAACRLSLPYSRV